MNSKKGITPISILDGRDSEVAQIEMTDIWGIDVRCKSEDSNPNPKKVVEDETSDMSRGWKSRLAL